MKDFDKEYSIENDVQFVDTQEVYNNHKNINTLFCDGVHQTKIGHQKMAEFLSIKLGHGTEKN